MKLPHLILALGSIVVPALADEPAGSKFLLVDDVLFYDTEKNELDHNYIHYSDIGVLRAQLQENPGISELVLNSEGGSLSTALEMGRIIADFNLATSVRRSCMSACVILFAAGRDRTAKNGALVGLHRPYTRADSLEDYYSENKDYESWDNTFEFSEWVYDDAQLWLVEYLNFMLKQGIDFKFLLASLRYQKMPMWYPDRSILLDAKLITNRQHEEPFSESSTAPLAKISMR